MLPTTSHYLTMELFKLKITNKLPHNVILEN